MNLYAENLFTLHQLNLDTVWQWPHEQPYFFFVHFLLERELFIGCVRRSVSAEENFKLL